MLSGKILQDKPELDQLKLTAVLADITHDTSGVPRRIRRMQARRAKKQEKLNADS